MLIYKQWNQAWSCAS